MPNDADAVVALERRFWDSLVDQDVAGAIALLTEPALMVSEHGAMQFDHEEYRRMAEKGPLVLKSYEFTDVNVLVPSQDVAIVTYRAKQVVGGRGESKSISQEVVDSSTWLRSGSGWKCAAHTETMAKARA